MERTEVSRLGRLARISLTDEELDRYGLDLQEFAAIFAALPFPERKGDGSTPLRLREDTVAPGLTRAEALASAPDAVSGGFGVPAVAAATRGATHQTKSDVSRRAVIAHKEQGTSGLAEALRSDKHNALLSVDDEECQSKRSGALSDWTFAIKDNIAVRGQPLTCGSRILGDYVSPFDATVSGRLRQAGAQLVAKANLDEFGMGSSGENSAFGATLHPSIAGAVPGGSSSGSAVAVAAGLVRAALGTDTGGSVRLPASFCGLVGIRPTYGRFSRFGVVAFASSLDQVGVLTKTTRDAAQVTQVLAGADPRDATSVARDAEDFLSACGQSIRGLRIGVLRKENEQADSIVQDAMNAAERALRSAGAVLVDIELPSNTFGLASYYVLAAAEAASNLARFDGMRYGVRVVAGSLEETYEATRALFGHEVKRRILLGTYALREGFVDEVYRKAEAMREAVRAGYRDAFAKVDVVLSPVAPSTAFPLADPTMTTLKMWQQDVFTLPPSLAGIPCMSVPSAANKWVGVQLAAAPWRESQLFAVAQVLETP